jgi:hypothetical protein
MPRTSSLSAALAAAALLAGCATAFPPPPPGAPEKARGATTYSASLRVWLEGPELRARTRALVAFRRPDAFRVEVPGPAGARLIAVAGEGRLLAVFPGQRAVFESEASASSFESLFGIALSPAELMDVLVGVPSPRLESYRVGWRGTLPGAIEATLPDGGRLKLSVDEAELDAALPEAAFEPPRHAVDAEEARRLWSR